jgi:hypothetical protein
MDLTKILEEKIKALYLIAFGIIFLLFGINSSKNQEIWSNGLILLGTLFFVSGIIKAMSEYKDNKNEKKIKKDKELKKLEETKFQALGYKKIKENEERKRKYKLILIETLEKQLQLVPELKNNSGGRSSKEFQEWYCIIKDNLEQLSRAYPIDLISISFTTTHMWGCDESILQKAYSEGVDGVVAVVKSKIEIEKTKIENNQ